MSSAVCGRSGSDEQRSDNVTGNRWHVSMLLLLLLSASSSSTPLEWPLWCRARFSADCVAMLGVLLPVNVDITVWGVVAVETVFVAVAYRSHEYVSKALKCVGNSLVIVATEQRENSSTARDDVYVTWPVISSAELLSMLVSTDNCMPPSPSSNCRPSLTGSDIAVTTAEDGNTLDDETRSWHALCRTLCRLECAATTDFFNDRSKTSSFFSPASFPIASAILHHIQQLFTLTVHRVKQFAHLQ